MVGLGASAAGVFGALYGLSHWLRTRYMSTLGSRRAESALLRKLACGMTVQRAETLLGPPMFRRPVEGVTGALEHLYRLEHCWLQLIVDGSAEVSRIAITSMDRKFRIDMTNLTLGMLRFTLGEVSFFQINQEPTGVWVDIGARRFRYAESYYFGNPGGYQQYLLCYNDTSDIGHAEPSILTSHGVLGHASGLLAALEVGSSQFFDLSSAPVRTFRSTARPNTLVIVRWDRDNLIDKPPFGPDLDHVRVLHS